MREDRIGGGLLDKVFLSSVETLLSRRS